MGILHQEEGDLLNTIADSLVLHPENVLRLPDPNIEPMKKVENKERSAPIKISISDKHEYRKIQQAHLPQPERNHS